MGFVHSNVRSLAYCFPAKYHSWLYLLAQACTGSFQGCCVHCYVQWQSWAPSSALCVKPSPGAVGGLSLPNSSSFWKMGFSRAGTRDRSLMPLGRTSCTLKALKSCYHYTKPTDLREQCAACWKLQHFRERHSNSSLFPEMPANLSLINRVCSGVLPAHLKTISKIYWVTDVKLYAF